MGERTNRFLPVELTEDERMDIAIKLSENLAGLEKLEDEKKAKVAEIKLKTDALDAQISHQHKAVLTGTEEREVACEWVYNLPVRGMKSLIRLDNNQAVDEKEMTDWDRQQAAAELQLPLFSPADNGS